MTHPLQHLLLGRIDGMRNGIYSVCSAHPWVIQAAAEQAIEDDRPLLLEATSNQVNQDGGYTGMKPADFRSFVEHIAEATGMDRSRLILGGDHLGPNPWRNLPSAVAMAKAEEMVDGYARAGFSKLHLDTSMGCSNETSPIPDELIAERAARLCAIAERAASEAELPGPVYVIGTEVPTPGGATHDLNKLTVTTTVSAQHTLEVHERAFTQYGLSTFLPSLLWRRSSWATLNSPTFPT